MVSCRAFDEIAVEGELANERIDLAQRQRHRRPAFQIPPDKAVGQYADLQGRLRGILDDGGAVFSGQREDAEDAPDPAGPFVSVNVIAHGTDRRPRVVGRAEDGQRFRGCAPRAIDVLDAMPAARRPDMLAQELPGLRIEQPDVEITPLHIDAPADPARRRTVVRRIDFDAAIEMDCADAEAVVAKRLKRQRAECGLLLRKHRGDLPFGRAVDPRVRPVLLPSIEIGLRRFDRLEAEALERRLLRVADARFDFAFAIGIADAARYSDRAVVREHIAIERIERRIVDVGCKYALFQVVEDDDLRRAAQTPKRAFVQVTPDLRTRAPCQEPDG